MDTSYIYVCRDDEPAFKISKRAFNNKYQNRQEKALTTKTNQSENEKAPSNKKRRLSSGNVVPPSIKTTNFNFSNNDPLLAENHKLAVEFGKGENTLCNIIRLKDETICKLQENYNWQSVLLYF
jgi:hypothetical protein